MTVGEKIRKRRLELDMSQTDLAKLLGYSSYTMLSKVENGDRGMAPEKIKQAANILKVPLEYLMGDDEVSELSEKISKLDESDKKVVAHMVNSLLTADKYKKCKKGLLDA